MDATTIGSALALVGVVSGSVVAYVGKRGETNLLRFDQVQEERDRKEVLLTKVEDELRETHRQQHQLILRITRLEIQIIRLGEEPVP